MADLLDRGRKFLTWRGVCVKEHWWYSDASSGLSRNFGPCTTLRERYSKIRQQAASLQVLFTTREKNLRAGGRGCSQYTFIITPERETQHIGYVSVPRLDRSRPFSKASFQAV
jgi:hypothetical protein